jgi:N utilization substance protein A
MRGSRIQAIVNELSGERIDVIKWDPDPAKFVANALSPANVIDVTVDLDDRRASVTVPDRMLSLAIGKEGQNARLAAKLTGWGIDIRSETAAASGENVTTFVPFQPGETPDIDIIQEAEEVAAAAELAAATAQPIPVSSESEEQTGIERAAALADDSERREDDVSFAAALAQMPVPDREEREAEDYGEEDDEEYEIPTVLAPDLRPSAIRFAEDVLPKRQEEEDPKKTAAKRPRRGPRFSEEEEDDEEQVDYRIH